MTHTAENDAAHDWKPTTNTLAVWKCGRCGAIGFDPHPLPKSGCVSDAVWQPAPDCEAIHPYGDEGWRPARRGHEHHVVPSTEVRP